MKYMSRFALESTLNEITKMEVPLERGPLLRWQRKAIEARMRSVSIDGYFFLLIFLYCSPAVFEFFFGGQWKTISGCDRAAQNLHPSHAVLQVHNLHIFAK